MTGRARDEERRKHGRADECRDDPSRGPAPTRTLDDRQRQDRDRSGQEQGADRVGEGSLLVTRLDEQSARGDERGKPDQEIDEEDPAPALPVDEHAAEAGTGGGRDGAGRAPKGGRYRPLLEWELREDEPERGWHEDRAADRLERTGSDQHVDVPGQPAHGRGGEEEQHAGEEEAAAAETVGEPPGGNERGGEENVVGVQDPREVGERGVREGGAQVGEGDVHDRHVEEAHEGCDRGDQQNLPATRHLPDLLSVA